MSELWEELKCRFKTADKTYQRNLKRRNNNEDLISSHVITNRQDLLVCLEALNAFYGKPSTFSKPEDDDDDDDGPLPFQKEDLGMTSNKLAKPRDRGR